jgi:hypothetical protein
MRWATSMASTFLILIFGVTAGATNGFAQICAGSPAAAGQRAIGPLLGFSKLSDSYGMELFANPDGPLGLGLAYTYSDVMNGNARSHAYSGKFNYEVPIANLSICPGVVAGYGSHRADPAVTSITSSRSYSADFGFGLGIPLMESDQFRLAPFVIPGYLVSRTIVSSSNPQVPASTHTTLHATIGLLVSTHRLFSTGAVSFTRGSGRSLIISAGLIF